MYKYRKIIYVFMVLALLFAGVATVIAHGLYEPTTTWGVIPQDKTFSVDRVCPQGTTLVPDAFGNVTNSVGTFSATYPIEGKDVTVIITTYADKSFDFEVVNGLMSQLFVKGGENQGYRLFQYDPKYLTASNEGPVSYDTGLHDGWIKGDEYQAVSHLDFCLIAKGDPLTATKTANAEYTRTYSWEIIKDYDGDYSRFIGDPAINHGYKVTVNQKVIDSAFKVTGLITVYNSNVYAVPFSITDMIGETMATVTCPVTQDGTGTVPSASGEVDGSITCSYVADFGNSKPDNGTNIATIKSGNYKVDGTTATAPYTFGDPTIVSGPAKINVSDTNGQSWQASGSTFWTYTKDFTCPTDKILYTDGKYVMPSDINTATITETGQSDSATVNLTCYAPVVSKTASGAYTEDHEWTIEKSVSPTPQNQFAGLGVDFTWKIDVVETISEYGFGVSGNITVVNPAAMAMTVSLVDVLNDSVPTPGVIGTCTNGATYVAGILTIPANTTTVCGYTASPGGRTANLNTATVTLNNIDFVATDAIEWTPTVKDASVTIDDDQWTEFPKTISDSATFSYPDSYTCSSNVADYAGDGTYQYKEDNTATLATDDGATESSKATAVVNCYAPVVTKTANASYKETWTWTLEKSVDETSNSGYPGDYLDWVWKVKVGETFIDSDWKVTGDITVINPAPMAMTVSLSDVLNDAAITPGVIGTCSNGASYSMGSLTIPANTTTICGYIASPSDYSATKNTATAVLNSIEFVGEAAVEFKKTVINGTAKVTDTMIDLNESLIAGDLGTREWDETYDHTCSTDRSAYVVDGSYGLTIDNTAYLTSDDQSLSSKATTEYVCKASFVDIYKTLNDAPAPADQDIQFTLFKGTTQLDTVSTFGVGPSLQFQTALVPADTYTICEFPVPAGYTFEVFLDGVNQITYAGPPGTEFPTGEVQCFDFVAAASGTTLTFDIENSYPGGAPRTPGYWKNWSTCSGGNQQYTAAALGGVEAGVYLLDDLLPQTLGSFIVETCEAGIKILSAQDVITGKNMASDAAYTLARALLAARLNQDAGACVPTSEMMDDFGFTSLENVLTEADALLAQYNFAGTGSVLSNKDKKVKEDYNYALSLAGIIDAYNNSEICIGEPSH